VKMEERKGKDGEAEELRKKIGMIGGSEVKSSKKS